MIGPFQQPDLPLAEARRGLLNASWASEACCCCPSRPRRPRHATPRGPSASRHVGGGLLPGARHPAVPVPERADAGGVRERRGVPRRPEPGAGGAARQQPLPNLRPRDLRVLRQGAPAGAEPRPGDGRLAR